MQTNVHFLNVDEEYFIKHVTRLPTRYRGEIINWSEVDQSKGYSQPFYTDQSTVKDDAQKFLMSSDDHYNIVKKHLAAFNCEAMEVIIKNILII